MVLMKICGENGIGREEGTCQNKRKGLVRQIIVENLRKLTKETDKSEFENTLPLESYQHFSQLKVESEVNQNWRCIGTQIDLGFRKIQTKFKVFTEYLIVQEFCYPIKITDIIMFPKYLLQLFRLSNKHSNQSILYQYFNCFSF